MDILNLGSGRGKAIPGAVTVDRCGETDPDIVHDLDRFPWPFPDAAFDVIHCRDVLEHLADLPRALEEIHRIGRPGGRVHITTPHFSCANAYTDPTHRQRLGYFSFDIFNAQDPLAYCSRARFGVVRRTLIFHPGLKNVLVWRLANRWPAFYEKHLTWILPAWFLSLELEIRS